MPYLTVGTPVVRPELNDAGIVGTALVAASRPPADDGRLTPTAG
jgi:hypothetical protein